MTYRILALDGGGARAMIPAVLVQRLQQREKILGFVDVFAGTSTSAITALMLAAGADLDEAAEAARTFWVRAGKLFSADSIRNLAAMAGTAAYFDPDPLKAALKETFGDRTVGDLTRKVVIPTVALDGHEIGGNHLTCHPEIIHNFDATFSDLHLRDAALRAAAMPILYPIRDGRIDASMLANNPAVCAIAQVLRAKAAALGDLRMLSIGTGVNPIGIGAKQSDWGYGDWLFDHSRPLALLQVVIESASSLADFQCEQLLAGVQYHRINPRLPGPSPLDERSPRFLVAAGDIADAIDLEPTVRWFGRSEWTGPRVAKSPKRVRAAATPAV